MALTGTAIQCSLVMLLTAFPSWAGTKDALLIVRGTGKGFTEVTAGISDELDGELRIEEMVTTQESDALQLAQRFRQMKPRAVVLMDNRSIRLYHALRMGPDSSVALGSAAVASVGVFVDKEIENLPGVCAIAYEIPPVTGSINLRSILNKPVSRIGVVHRTFMTPYIDEHAAYCAREGIAVKSVVLPDSYAGKSRTLHKALRQLIETDSVNALWVPNDSRLLSQELIRQVWSGLASRYSIPVIVGVEVLADPQLDFGTLAVTPDHFALGAQIGAKVLTLMQTPALSVKQCNEPPLSIIKSINFRQAEKVFGLQRKALQAIDKVIE